MNKSDNWIRQMCETPTHCHRKINGVNDLISAPFSKKQEEIIKRTESNKLLASYTANVASISGDDGNHEVIKLPQLTMEVIEEITDQEMLESWSPMITPFLPKSLKHMNGHKVISSGLSSYGYDVRLSKLLRIFTNINSMVIDPYDIDPSCYIDAEIKVDEKGFEYAILPPNSFLLGHTIEYFNIPNDVIVIALGKSTWARAGVSVIITPIEPGFKGEVVIEVANQTSLPVKIYVNVGISQFIFFQSDEACDISYGDREGKYQNQTGITMPKV